MVDRQRLLYSLLRRDFPTFVRKVFATVSAGDAFVDNWHMEAIYHCLQQIGDGDLKRLIVTQPPRSLKSIIMSVAWPAWILGQDPTREIIGVSYAQELADALARDCRTVMESDWYRRAFPGHGAGPQGGARPQNHRGRRALCHLRGRRPHRAGRRHHRR